MIPYLFECYRGIMVLFLPLFFADVFGQHIEEFEQIHYTDESGLPQNSVNAIAKDSKGFVWLGTESGLVRFDGQSFFTYDKTNLNIPNNRIRFFLPKAGRSGSEALFYAFDGMGTFIGVYSDSYARVSRYPGEESQGSSVTTRPGTRYIAGLPDVFGALDVDTLATRDVSKFPLGNHTYFIRDNGNLAYYSDSARGYRLYFPTNRELFFSKGNLYAIRKNRSVMRVDSAGPHVVTIKGDILREPRFESRRMNFFWNNISQQTFIHYRGNLYLADFTKKNEADTRLLLSGMDLTKHGVISVYLDENGRIFLGCRTEGLYLFRKKQFHAVTVPADSMGSVFYALVPTGDNRVMVRSGYNIDLSGKTSIAAGDREKLGSRWWWYFLAKDQNKNLWVGESVSSVDRVLAKYTPDGSQELGRWNVPGTVDAFYCDPFGQTWLASGLDSLYSFSSASSGESRPRLFCRLKIGAINTFHRSDRRTLWLGSSKGFFRLDLPSRKCYRFTALAGKNVRHIYASGNELWICTYGDGIYLYRNRILTHFPYDQDRYISSAHCIVPDSNGRFWISTNKGLFVTSRSSLLAHASDRSRPVFYYYFDKSSGFETNEFNGGCQPCGVRLASGNIVFPSLRGLVYFNPDHLKMEFPDKALLVKGILVDGKVVGQPARLTVERDFEQIQVFVSTPYFEHPKNVHFSYLLSNGHSNRRWIPVKSDQGITLTGLNPGQYTLHIRKTNDFLGEGVAEAALEISVLPRWYETSWFSLILFSLSLALVYLVIRTRSRHLRKKMLTRNLLNNVRLYGDLITSINHDIQTPMHYVIYSLEQVAEYLENQPADAKITALGNETLLSLRRISTLTNNLLQYLKVNLYQKDSPIIASSFALEPLVSQTMEMFSAKIARDHIRIYNRIPRDSEYVLNPRIFSVILHNLVDNAVKVSKNGSVTLSILKVRNKVFLSIEDSGKGMPQEIADWLMEKHDQNRNKLVREERMDAHQSGLGLILVKDLCRLSGTELTVARSDGRGTQILLSLRMPGH